MRVSHTSWQSPVPHRNRAPAYLMNTQAFTHSALRTPVLDLLGCELPILQAGMGGVARAELAAAVSNAGGLGCLGMVREAPEFIAAQIGAVREETDRPFAVNLIPAATEPSLLDEEVSVCIESRVPIVVLFWDVDIEVVRRLRDAGIIVLHQVGSVAAATEAEFSGAQAIIAQGNEAGGHVHGSVSSMVLIPRIVAATRLPVIASGGIATGAGLVAALSLGAQAVHCGTAFLATHESFAHKLHKRRVRDAAPEQAQLTSVYAINWPPNSPTRALSTSLTEHPEEAKLALSGPAEAIATQDGRPIYRYSTDSPLRDTTGNIHELAFFAGQSVGLVHHVRPAAMVVNKMIEQASEVLRRFSDNPCREQEYYPMNAEFASPPCYAHEFEKSEQATPGFMPCDEVVELLNELLSCERAGAKTTKYFGDQGSATIENMMQQVAEDERFFVHVLTDHIERLGGTPGTEIGAFYDKAISIVDEKARLKFLNRGQAWVVATLRKAIPRIADRPLRLDLQHMLAVHIENIQECEVYLGQRAA